jgi:WD40 repeat protein
MVKLWRVSSISSAPLQQLEEDRPVNTPDGMVKCFDDHEDSVYSIAWSSYEPWVFASLSYDGRVVVGNVPSAEKYKILLD